MRRLIQKLFPISYPYRPALLHPRVSNVVHHLLQQDHKEVTNLFDGLSSCEISLLNEGVSELVQQDDLLDSWFDDSNGPALSCLLRGTIMLKRAWYYRGWGRGEDVSDDRFGRMYWALDMALNSLAPIVDHPKYGSEACARLIKVQKGLDASWDDIDAVLNQMWSFENINLIGETNYLIASCEKWLGSHDKMFQFAKDRASYRSDHPELGALLAVAHYERHMYLERFDEDQTAADKYKSNPAIIDDLLSNRSHLLETTNSPKDSYVFAHNIFAGVLSEFGQYELAMPHFEAIGSSASPYPWHFIGIHRLQHMYNKAMSYAS